MVTEKAFKCRICGGTAYSKMYCLGESEVEAEGKDKKPAGFIWTLISSYTHPIRVEPVVLYICDECGGVFGRIPGEP